MNLNDAWAKPCPCNALTSGASYCNYASGFCNEGISPFGDPLSSCPAAGVSAFVDDTAYRNAMCWTFQASFCISATDSLLTACIRNRLASASPTVSGPHLCRDFCSPSIFNLDNRLIFDYNFGCVCAIGWSVGLGQPAPNYFSTPITSGRKLQSLSAFNSTEIIEDSYGNNDAMTFQTWKNYYNPHYNISLPQTAGGATFCVDDNDCLVSTTKCESQFGPRACASCPTRNFYSDVSGHSCQRGRCVCEPVPSIPQSADISKIVWTGTSRCALLGKAYGNETNTSTAIFVELRYCAHKHVAGLVLGHPLRHAALTDAPEPQDPLVLIRPHRWPHRRRGSSSVAARATAPSKTKKLARGRRASAAGSRGARSHLRR